MVYFATCVEQYSIMYYWCSQSTHVLSANVLGSDGRKNHFEAPNGLKMKQNILCYRLRKENRLRKKMR